MNFLWNKQDEDDLFLLLLLREEEPPVTTTLPPFQEPLNDILGLQDIVSVESFLPHYEILGLRDIAMIYGVYRMPGQAATPIVRPCGSGMPIGWTYLDSADRTTPINLDNVEDIILTVRMGPLPSSILIFQKSLLNGDISIISATLGEAQIAMNESDTASTVPGRYYYSIKVIFTSGASPDYPTSGPFTLTPHC